MFRTCEEKELHSRYVGCYVESNNHVESVSDSKSSSLPRDDAGLGQIFYSINRVVEVNQGLRVWSFEFDRHLWTSDM